MTTTQSHKKILLIDLTTYTQLNNTERNAYSFYVSLMLKFNNNVIYKATNKRLSELTGIHRNSVSKYIKILLKHDYIAFDSENLELKPFQKDKKLFRLSLYRSLSAEKTKELIEIEILRLNINKQLFAIQFKTDIRLNRNKMSNKRYKKNANLVHGDFNKDIMFSIRYAAKKLNVSTGKIQSLLKSASDNHIIKTKYVYKYLTECRTFKEFKQYQASFLKTFEGYFNLNYNFKTKKVFQLVGTDIIFNLELT